jgi:hypothetical protein
VLARSVWLAPSGVAATAWWMLGRLTMHGDSLADAGEIGHMSTLRSARAIGLWSFDIWRSHTDELCAVAWWGALVVLLVAGLKARRPGGDVRAYVPLACAALLYFLLPFRVGAGAMLNVRMAPVLALFAILTLDAPDPASLVARGARVVAMLVCVVTGVNAAIVMRNCERDETDGLDELFAHTRTGARLVSLAFDAESSYTHFPPWLHTGAYHRARKGGVSSFSFTELHHWSLHYVPDKAPPKKSEAFWDFHPCLFRNGEDGGYYDYVLVRGDVDLFRDKPPGPAWKKVATARRFVLWEKVDGAFYPAWPAPLVDAGPCRDRSDIEAATVDAAPRGYE